MNNREKIRRVFRGEISRLPPVSIRLDLWHRWATETGALPADVRALSAEEVEDYLGFCRAARFAAMPALVLGNGSCRRQTDSGTFSETYRVGARTLARVTAQTEEGRRAGLQGHIVEYPLKSREDCREFLAALREAALTCDTAGFDAFDARTGGRGLPMLMLGPCPAHTLMLRWTGYENFYLFYADFPELLDETIDVFNGLYRRDVWPAARAGKAELVLHGAHFSGAMTPPPVFRCHFLPYFREFNGRMHQAPRKAALCHADADLGGLLPLVAEAGFDGADCLATSPMATHSLEDHFAAWQGRIVCWGGLPGMLLDPSCPLKTFAAHVDRLRAVAAGRRDVIVGVSDNVMPGARWERLRHVSEVFCERG